MAETDQSTLFGFLQLLTIIGLVLMLLNSSPTVLLTTQTFIRFYFVFSTLRFVFERTSKVLAGLASNIYPSHDIKYNMYTFNIATITLGTRKYAVIYYA